MPLHEAATLGKDGLEIDCLGLQAAVIRVREWGFPESAENASVFRRRGEFWVLAYDGSTVYLADSVGLSYVARLLSEPNRDIPAVALLAARVGIDPRVASGSMGSILDETGRRNYRARYRELQESMAVAAADALVRGIAHFFPSDRRPILTRLWTATTKTRGEVSKMAAAKLDSPQMEQAIRRAIQATSDEIDRRLSEFGDLSGSLPESSASIPTA